MWACARWQWMGDTAIESRFKISILKVENWSTDASFQTCKHKINNQMNKKRNTFKKVQHSIFLISLILHVRKKSKLIEFYPQFIFVMSLILHCKHTFLIQQFQWINVSEVNSSHFLPQLNLTKISSLYVLIFSYIRHLSRLHSLFQNFTTLIVIQKPFRVEQTLWIVNWNSPLRW